MKHYLRLELNRAFRGWYMAIALLVGCGLSLWHFYDYIWPLRTCVLQGSYPLSSFDRWIGGENYSYYNRFTVRGTVASRVFFRIVAKAVRMGEHWSDVILQGLTRPSESPSASFSFAAFDLCR